MPDGKKILIIDDDPMTLRVLTTLLSAENDLRIANSAPQAMNLMIDFIPQVILLDIEMPGMTGFEFLHTIRKNPKFMSVPVVIVSSHSEPEFSDHADRMGASCLVAKPIEKEDLLQKITFAIQHPKKNIWEI